MRRPLRQSTPARGFTLIAILSLLVAGVLALLIATLGPEVMEAWRLRKTEAALAQAREALIGYALQHRDRRMAQDPPKFEVYGYLPLPDLGESQNKNALLGLPCLTEGCAKQNNSGTVGINTYIGRLPWKTLGTEPLRDGYGECLWYIVSAGHKDVENSATMNWDSLGQTDVVTADGVDTVKSILATAHDRPIAIVFSPGPIIGNQIRNTQGPDDVTECRGNYDPANYLDPAVVSTYLNSDNIDATAETKYFDGSASVDTSTERLAVAIANSCPTGSTCTLDSNDRGLAIAPDTLFSAIRNNTNFRTDINSLLDRIVGCLRDDISAAGFSNGIGKIAGDDDNPCYGKDVVPRGYYPNYKELLFVAADASAVNGEACAGAVVFANQRGTNQLRVGAGKNDPVQYLEGVNLTGSAGPFSGQEVLERKSDIQGLAQDIVRCIPTTPGYLTVQSAEAGVPQMANYDRGSGTLTLGHLVPDPIDSALANYLYGCAWTPEARSMGGGLRSYFNFRINDSGFTTAAHEGFMFAVVDGDNNKVDACGAAAQHLGYSGNNTETPFITQPKIAFEVDPRREGAIFPSSNTSHLTNGRNDPPTDSDNYRGGHVALVYWGGETPISAPSILPCAAPAYSSSGVCTLPQEEDDNVHGQSALARSGFPAPPPNPAAPLPPLAVLPPNSLAGVYKLDPNRAAVPVNQLFHVRLELTRATTSDFNLPQVRVATTASIDLTNPPQAIDGIFLVTGDRVLVKNQLDATRNGVYVWHSTETPLVRAADADTTVELAGLVIEVRQGTVNARSIWRQANTNATIDSDALAWTNARVKVAAPATTNLSSPGKTLDGILMSFGDRVLVMGVGIYVWRSPWIPMLPASDIVAGSAIQVQQGSQATAWWRFDGTTWQRLAVRVATPGPIDLSSPGPAIDGVTLTGGNRVLVKDQGHAAENGIYVWTGSGTAMTRSTDADSASELAGTLTQVLEGQYTGRAFRQVALSASGTLGTNPVQWTAIDRAPSYLLEAWILRDGVYTQRINAMKDTTRPMAILDSSFTAHLRDTPTIPYPFRNVRLGFTTGQRTSVTDQTITIRNSFTTWLP